MRRHHSISGLRVGVGAAAVVLLASAGTVVAWGAGAFTSAIPSNNTLTACYPSAGSLKAMYLIYPATTPTCPNGFTMVTFNQQGQQGGSGPTGAMGPSGPSGASGTGASGPSGPSGPSGASGPSGPTGASGTNAGPTVLMASSGPPVILDLPYLQYLPMSGVGINYQADQVAQAMPRSGTLTSLSATFVFTQQTMVPASTIVFQVESAAAGSDTYSAVAGATCTLNVPGGSVIAPGSVLSCTSTFSAPFASGDRLAVENQSQVPGLISGVLSASTTIS